MVVNLSSADQVHFTRSQASGAVLIEDDYDGEFRFDIPPVSSMAGMRPDARVACIGTMSKVLDPGLRLAYLRVPPALMPDVLDARESLASTVSTQGPAGGLPVHQVR
jgi:GntR family transcriptional regulator / MocR family aminotransferase